MPYEFLNDQQLAQYGTFTADPTPEQLVDCFRLNERDFELVHAGMQPHTRLGMALQLGTLGFLGTFLSDPTAVPRVAVRYVAEQLGIKDLRLLRAYLKRRPTRFAHAKAIREHLGYKEFDALEGFHLRRLIYAKLLVTDERPIELFDLCTVELVRRRVVLPGATTVARLVVEVRERASTRLYHNLARRLSEEQKRRLGDLLIPLQGERRTPFDQLRTPPTRVSAPALVAALGRVEAIRAVGVSDVLLQDVPDSRLGSLSKYAEVAWAGQLAKLSRERCYATLLAYMHHLEKSAADDALDVFEALMTSLGLRSGRKWRRERLRSLKDLDSSALLLRDAARVLCDPSIPDAEVRKAAFSRVPQAMLLEADARVTELASPEGEEEPQAWQNATSTVSKFILKLLVTLEFEATPTGKPLLAAMSWLAEGASGRKAKGRGEQPSKAASSDIPRDFVPRGWGNLVFPKGEMFRPAYTVCLALQLQQALKHHEVFVTKSYRHGDPRARLLQGAEWEARRSEVCRSLGLSQQPEVEIQKLTDQLGAAYSRVLGEMAADTKEAVRLEEVDGILTPVVAHIEALPESPSFKDLDANITARLPEIDLSELLLEVDAATGFCDVMPLVSEGGSKISDLAVSICGVLVAQACNIGLKAVAQHGSPALSLGRLAWVQQNYVRSDTILNANAKLVEVKFPRICAG